MGLLQDHRGPTRAQLGKREHMLARTNKKDNQRNIRSVITEQLYRKENLVGNIGLGRIIKCHFTKCKHSLSAGVIKHMEVSLQMSEIIKADDY